MEKGKSQTIKQGAVISETLEVHRAARRFLLALAVRTPHLTYFETKGVIEMPFVHPCHITTKQNNQIFDDEIRAPMVARQQSNYVSRLEGCINDLHRTPN
jgi:hypothetical protein